MLHRALVLSLLLAASATLVACAPSSHQPVADMIPIADPATPALIIFNDA